MTTDLSLVKLPIGQARGLPNPHYTEAHVFDEERDAVLHAGWTGLGVGWDVPEIGDAKPITFLGLPLLMLRGKDNVVRVFQNTCRHRGMILVEEARKIEGAIRCPYHSWCYSTQGKLVATPHIGGPGHNTHEEIDRDTMGLIEIRSHIWRDVVFINVSGKAAPFEEVHADLIARWAEVDQPLYHGGADSAFELAVATNYKLAVENYCESYHLPWIHPGLNSYSRLEDHYNIDVPDKYSGQGTLVYRQMVGQEDTRFPDFDGLSEQWDEGAEYIALYPNVLLGAQRDHAFAIVLEPRGIDQTVEHVHLYYAQPNVDEEMRRQNTTLWKEVFEEDIFVVEGMQRGRYGPGFDGGRFSPAMDGPTHCFHRWVADRILEHRQAQMDASVEAGVGAHAAE